MHNGQLTKDNSCRWCEICNQDHGFLYPCKNYPKEILDEILKESDEFKNLCISGEIKISINGITKTWNKLEEERLLENK